MALRQVSLAFIPVQIKLGVFKPIQEEENWFLFVRINN